MSCTRSLRRVRCRDREHPNASPARSCPGERAGLVRTQHIRRSEVLDGVQAFDDYFLAAIAIAPFDRLTVTIMGSISGVNRRLPPWQKEGFQPVVLAQPVDQEYGGTITAINVIISQVNL